MRDLKVNLAPEANTGPQHHTIRLRKKPTSREEPPAGLPGRPQVFRLLKELRHLSQPRATPPGKIMFAVTIVSGLATRSQVFLTARPERLSAG